MNVLIVASKFPPEYTGPGVRIPRLYDSIGEAIGLERKYVYCNGMEHIKADDYEYKGFQVKRRTVSWPRNLPKVGTALTHYLETVQAMETLQKYKTVDLVHILGNSGATAAALAFARARKIPVLMELVTAEATPLQRFNLFRKIGPPKKSVIIALTQKAAEKCARLGFSKAQIWQRPNPIDENIFKPEPNSRAQLRKKFMPFDKNDIVISSVAKIMPQKNQLFLIEVLRRLPENFKLFIGGPLVREGPLYARDKAYLDQIYNNIAQYNLASRVHIVTDFVKAPVIMKASDIYALPAWNEGFGTPMIEAIACGLPAVANEGEAAFREWIVPGENGFLCSLDDPQGWAGAFEQAAVLPPEKRLANAALMHQKAGQNVIFKDYVRRIESLIS